MGGADGAGRRDALANTSVVAAWTGGGGGGGGGGDGAGVDMWLCLGG